VGETQRVGDFSFAVRPSRIPVPSLRVGAAGKRGEGIHKHVCGARPVEAHAQIVSRPSATSASATTAGPDYDRPKSRTSAANEIVDQSQTQIVGVAFI